MTTNPYINQVSDTSEQSLIQSLITEAIQFYGRPIVYLPKTIQREDTLYNEDVLLSYTEQYGIEAFVANVMGWTGQGNLMSKFGIKMDDQATLVVSRERFTEVFAIPRPSEGDLVYIPAPINAMFEVRWVEHERGEGQFYPLGKLHYWEIKLQSYVYNQQTINTGNTTIDCAQTSRQFPESGVDIPNDPTSDNRYLQDASSSVVSEE